MKSIPISAASDIAERYDCDQVVVVARKVGKGGAEYVTTYGRNKAHCDVAGQIGMVFKHEIMKWPRECKARAASMGANDPQDCNWPMCGCDPYADKVIAALQESGVLFEDTRKAHKTMTAEEYAAMPVVGWHMVCRDYDGAGGTGVRFISDGVVDSQVGD